MSTAGIELKIKLKNECIRIQKGQVATSKTAMLHAQETANDEKSTMEDKFESFREQMQIERDMYAKKYDDAMVIMQIIEQIDSSRLQTAAATGCVVVTPDQNYYVSYSLGKIVVDGQTYMAISHQSPIFKAMAGKKKGEKFEFRDKIHEITDVF